jgi:PKD repeat protein
VIRTIALFVVVSFFSTLSAFAQYWPKPAATPGVDVKCVGCVGNKNNLMTPGYPATISTFTGRFLDSQATQDYQQPFRTARAFHVYPAPSRNRIYMIIGSAVFAYDINTFFTRLAQHEDLMDANSVPVSGPYAGNKHPFPVDKFLRYDEFFYAENEPSGWTTPQVDGQERLFQLDYDDQGYVYLAYRDYGWGIVKDDGTNTGALMANVYQDTTNYPDTVLPQRVIALRSTDGSHYYAVIGTGGGAPMNVFDVTNRSTPSRLVSIQRSVYLYAKAANNSRLAVTTSDGKLQIYTAEGFATGSAPIFTDTGAGPMHGVTSDGTNFYVTSDSGGLILSVYAPSGSTYAKVADYRTASYGSLLSTTSLTYSDGYLVWAGYLNGSAAIRVFKLVNGQPTEVDFSIDPANATQFEPKRSYFKYYYSTALDSTHTFPGFSAFWDSAVVKRNNKTYLIVMAYSLGDVYELPSTDSVTVTNLGPSGTANPGRPADAGAGTFYGDPIAFKATTGAASPMNITWDFGNPEAAAGADANTATGLTGDTVKHRFSGLTSAASLPISRTVKATNVTDSSINSSVSVTLQKPAVRFGVGNYKFLFVQPNASSPAPIVAGDRFFDGSDGLVESHYNTWSIDGGAAVKTVPPGAVDVGACGQHTLTFDAHYGPYVFSPSIASLGSDMDIGLGGGFTYGVRPYAAAIDIPTSDTANVTFHSLSRVSGDSTAITGAQAAILTYRWELLNASNAVIGTPVTGTAPNAVVPDFVVAKSSFAGLRNVRAHLVLSGAAVNGCANFTSAEAFTNPLSAPDFTITGGCTSGGPPCSFTATPAAGIDPAADGWTYSWSVSGGSYAASVTTGSTFAPVFQQATTYTVSVTVTNAIASTAKSISQVVTTAGSTCPQMTSGNVFIAYHNGSNTCSQSVGTCGVGETLVFSAAQFNYDNLNFACASHTFTWDFGDGQTGSGQFVNHAYAAPNTYLAKLTISNPGQTITVTQNVSVGGVQQPPPPPPGPPVTPPPPAGCGTMTGGINVFPHYAGPVSGCSEISGNCNTGEAVAFAAQAFGYDFSCATHNFTWNFGDTQVASGQSVTHAYSTAGTYTVSLTITNSTQSVTATTTVKVGGSPTPPTPTPPTPTPPTGNCQPVVSGVTFFVDYVGPQSGCTQYQGDCSSSETIPFTLKAFNYDFGCAQHTFQWDFNDNSTPGTGQSVSHRYVGAGAYNLKVTVTVNGQSYLVGQTVKVTGGGPIQPTPGSTYAFDFTSSPLLGVPNAYTFSAFPTGSASSANVTYTWDFGDGHSDTTTSPTTIHVYADAKVYTVTLSVSGYPGNTTHPVVSRRRPSHH